MKNTLLVIFAAALAMGAEKKITLNSMPTAVQNAVKQQTEGAIVRGYTAEVEHGKTFYEAQLTVNGRAKDISFDSSGHVVSVEEEMSLDAIPAAAREAINKAVGAGKLVRVEQATENGKISYEATIKNGAKTKEFVVDASGKPVK